MEPLRTDEALPPGSKQKTKDFESVILGGCTSFVLVSIFTYLLAIWPFLVFQNLEFLRTLLLCSAFGLLVACILGAIASRKLGLAGACGFLAGAMSVTVFLSLRLDQSFLSAAAGQTKEPQYPSFFRFFVPIFWLVLSLTIAVLFTKKSEISLKSDL